MFSGGAINEKTALSFCVFFFFQIMTGSYPPEIKHGELDNSHRNFDDFPSHKAELLGGISRPAMFD